MKFYKIGRVCQIIAIYAQQRNSLPDRQRYTECICNPQHNKARPATSPACAAPPHKVRHCKAQPPQPNGSGGLFCALRYNQAWIVQPPTFLAMTHEPRLTHALRNLLNTQRVAALGTLDEASQAFVSMVPFAIDASRGDLVIHVSGLAAHARNLERTPRVSVMVMQAETAGEPVHALQRVTLDGVASVVAVDSAPWAAARAAYLARFSEVEYMTQLGDFRFVAIAVNGARQVAGFGAARSIDSDELAQLLRKPT